MAGLGIYEYTPAGLKNPYIDKLIRFGLALKIPVCSRMD